MNQPIGAIAPPPVVLLREKLSRIELKNTPFPMFLQADSRNLFGMSEYEVEPLVTVLMSVRDRDTGEYGKTIKYQARVPLALLASKDAMFFDWLRRAVLYPAIEHEIDECIHVDGQRMFDPHRNERT